MMCACSNKLSTLTILIGATKRKVNLDLMARGHSCSCFQLASSGDERWLIRWIWG